MRISDWSSDVCSSDLSVRPSERFRAYANGAYTDAKYESFVDAPCPPELSGGTASAPNCDISGQRLPGVSKWAFSFGAEANADRSEEHTSELQSLMRISYAVFCLKKKNK